MNQENKKALIALSDGVIGAGVLLMAGVYGGQWLDGQLNTAPWFSIGLAMTGGGLGLARMVYKATQLGKGDEVDRAKSPAGKPPAPSTMTRSDSSLKQRRPFDNLDDEEN